MPILFILYRSLLKMLTRGIRQLIEWLEFWCSKKKIFILYKQVVRSFYVYTAWIGYQIFCFVHLLFNFCFYFCHVEYCLVILYLCTFFLTLKSLNKMFNTHQDWNLFNMLTSEICLRCIKICLKRKMRILVWNFAVHKAAVW